MSFRPIFIAGCDRSGTTLLGDLLGAAPGAFAVPESQWMHDYLLGLQSNAFASPLAAATWLQGHFRYAAWNMPLSVTELAALITLQQPRRTLERIIQAYLDAHAPERAHGRVWIDHTPDNFLRYPLLRGLFPDARYIHIVRDGRGVCQSIKPLDWGPNNAYSATRHWTKRVLEGLAVEAGERENCQRIRYEDLLNDPYGTLQQLCAFTALDYTPQLVEGGGLVVPAFTRDQHQLVGQRPDPARVNAWRQRLSRRDIVQFEAYPTSRQLLTAFGYRLDTADAAPTSALTSALAHTHEFLMYFVHRMRHRRMETRVIEARRDAPRRSGVTTPTHRPHGA